MTTERKLSKKLRGKTFTIVDPAGWFMGDWGQYRGVVETVTPDHDSFCVRFYFINKNGKERDGPWWANLTHLLFDGETYG